MTTWRATALSVSPPSIAVADTDIRALLFDAGEAITDATAQVTTVADGTDVTVTISDGVTVGAEDATVTVSGFTRETAYELAVTFERANGTTWTRTLILDCVT